MPEGRPALQRQGSRKKREGGLQAPLLLFRFVCLFVSLSLSLKPLLAQDSWQILLGSQLSSQVHKKDTSIFPRR